MATRRQAKSRISWLIRAALEQFVARRKARAFERSMGEMAADPQVAYDSRLLSDEFSQAESDRLHAV